MAGGGGLGLIAWTVLTVLTVLAFGIVARSHARRAGGRGAPSSLTGSDGRRPQDPAAHFG